MGKKMITTQDIVYNITVTSSSTGLFERYGGGAGTTVKMRTGAFCSSV